MKQGKGILTERAKYVATMASLLAERAERYENEMDTSIEKYESTSVYCGFNVGQADCKENVKRMIVQLRMELSEMGRML